MQSRPAGLVIISDGALVAASSPIITSDFKGPIRGSVVMGKFVNDRMTEDFSALVQMQVKLYRLSDPALPQNVQNARDDLLTQGGKLSQPLSETRIAGYTLLNDLTGNPALLLQVEAPRAVYAQAQRSRRILTGASTTGSGIGICKRTSSTTPRVSQPCSATPQGRVTTGRLSFSTPFTRTTWAASAVS